MKLFVQFRKWLRRGPPVAVLLMALAGPVWGQCAMCREAAKSQNAEAIAALSRGILVLAVPPFAILLGIGVLTYRYRNSPQRPLAASFPRNEVRHPPEDDRNWIDAAHSTNRPPTG